MKVIILAAGKGTRMEGKPEGLSKCAMKIQNTDGPYDTPITRLISQVRRSCNPISDIIVVGGYGLESVSDAVKKYRYSNAPIRLIYNNMYEEKGCNFSLSCAAPLLNEGEDALILEGDSIYKDGIITNFLNRTSDLSNSASLVRGRQYLNDNSVCVTVDEITGKVIRYVYDENHKLTDCLDYLNKFEGVLFYESMQAWLIKGKDVSYLKRRLTDYSIYSKTHSGVYSINQSITDGVVIQPVLCDRNDSQYWINLNTKKDLDKVEKLILKGEL